MASMLTDKAIGVAWVSSQPEFADYKGVRALYGLSRAHAYLLAAEGKIRSVLHSARRRNARKKAL